MSTYFKKASRVIALLLVISTSLLGNTTIGTSVAHAQAEMTGTSLPDGWQNYIDSEYGFQVGYPNGWTGEVAFENDTEADDKIVRRFTISNEEFAFINIDIWNNSAGLSIPEWIKLRQASLVDKTIVPETSNVTISGTEGFLVIQSPDPEVQRTGRIVTVLSNDEFIYRIEYIAQDGGAAQEIYRSVLETFEFKSASTGPDGTQADSTPEAESTPTADLPQAPFFNVQASDVTTLGQKDYVDVQNVNLAATFSKKEPADGATGVATTVTLRWDAASPAPIKYRYSTDPNNTNWTSIYGTEVTLTGLAINKRYYWQVQAVYCEDCVPKEVVSANDGNWWSFVTVTSASTVTISGNAGVPGAILSYTDGSAKTVTAGTDGGYTITVPKGWTGTVTPSKAGYAFAPANRGYTNLQASVTGQNYTGYVTISGNAGIGGATINYTGGAVTSGTDGSYTITVPYGWSGTVIPSKTGYTFSPPNRSYSSVQASLTNQNFSVVIIISGNTDGIAGVTLDYTGGTVGAVSDSAGNYSFTVPYKTWVGVVLPTHPCYNFTPEFRSYTRPETNQTGQNYAATLKPEGCVLSITRSTADITNAATVSFIVEFSEDVTGVGTADFALTTFGLTGTSIASVSSISGSLYSVTVNAGDGNGSIRLDVRGDATINSVDPGGSIAGLPFTSGEVYTIMNTTAPVAPADFNGDGKTDLAVFRPSNGNWYVRGMGSTHYGTDDDIPAAADYTGDGKADIVVFRPSVGTWYIRGSGSLVYGTAGDIPVPADYNGDGKAEIAVFRPFNGTWYIRGMGSFVYGAVGDIPVPADYNGDGRADLAIFRPSDGSWHIYGVGDLTYGSMGDIPVPADYNGDGKTDVAIFHPVGSTWHINGVGAFPFGQAGDIPVMGDYNGDRKDEIAVFRPSNGKWYIKGAGLPDFGQTGDKPVPADYDGDGKTDFAFFHPADETWHIANIGSLHYGIPGDQLTPADYNGDGRAEIAVYRPSNGTWYLRGIGPTVYGTSEDIPVPADYNGDGKDEIAVYRPSNGTWYLRGIGPTVYGTSEDIPVPADYNGDGKAEIAVFRPSNNTWYIRGIGPTVHGIASDTLVPADYNGDGKADIAVFRPSNNTWYIYGIGNFSHGQTGDIPAIGDYDGDGKADITVFHPADGTWSIYGVGPYSYGLPTDIPV